MSNVQSYNALIDRFKAFASGHFILKTFSHGQIDTADLEKFTEYPFMHVVPSNVTYAKGTKTFSFQIVLADLPRDKDDKVEFQREVLSDLQRIAEDLVAEITNHRVLFGDLITVQNVSLEPFLEEFHNTLTGWTVSLELLVPYYWDACSIPAEWNDMFESSTGGTGSILTFIDSITRDEYGNVSLVNDEATPAPNYYYGTNDEGVRGWYLLTDEVGLTCATIGSCQTIIDIEAAIDALEEEILLKADITSISAVGFSNDYNDLDNKPTIPDVSGFVPYTGATADVDLGTHDLTATQGTFATSGSSDTLTVNHSSGSGKAITITKGGAGEGIYVNKTSGSGNAVTIVGDLEATTLKKTGGTSSQFLKADGSVDSSTYVPDTRTLTINGTSYDLSADRSWTISASASLAVGTTPITSGTVGSVLFEGTGNVLQQSGSLFWDNTNDRLGIGTASPTHGISHVGTAGVASFFSQRDYGFNVISQITQRAYFYGRYTNNLDAGIGIGGNARGNTSIQSFNANTNAAKLLSLNYYGGNVIIGDYTADAGYKLDVNGTARVKGVGTTTGVSLSVQNSAGTDTLKVFDNGQIYMPQAGGSSLFLDRIGSYTSTSISIVRFFVGSGSMSASADIQINSTTRGFLPPRMTTTQRDAIATPAAGLVVYQNTDNYLSLYNGTNWQNVLSPNSSGNVLIGTTTDAGFKLDVNGTARIQAILTILSNVRDNRNNTIISQSLSSVISNRILTIGNATYGNINFPNGNVLINTTTDAGYKLDVNGTARVSDMSILSASGTTTSTLTFFANGNTTNAYGFIRTSFGASSNFGRLNFATRFLTTTSIKMILDENGSLNVGTAIADASAVLQADSTTKGFLPPRMTTTQKNAIASPVAGLVVYDTTLGKLCVRGASAWETITSV